MRLTSTTPSRACMHAGGRARCFARRPALTPPRGPRAADNGKMLSGSADKHVFVWDVASGAVERKLRGHTGRVNCVRVNPETTVCVSGAYDATVRCWDLRSNSFEPMQTLDDAKDSVSAVVVRAGHAAGFARWLLGVGAS